MSDFPNRLKKLRSDSKLTQKQLAEQLNVSQNAVYNWENGKREPNLDMMKKIAKVFDIALYMLLDDTYPLPDITSDAWKNRARFVGDTEMEHPPLFMLPRSESNVKNQEDEINKLNLIIEKANNGSLTDPAEVAFLERQALLRIGPALDKYFSQLNDKGRVKANEQIDRLMEQLELLTKVPEYQKK